MDAFSWVKTATLDLPKGIVMPSRFSLVAALLIALGAGLAAGPVGAADPTVAPPALNPGNAGWAACGESGRRPG